MCKRIFSPPIAPGCCHAEFFLLSESLLPSQCQEISWQQQWQMPCDRVNIVGCLGQEKRVRCDKLQHLT